jgi:hypothetical protein
MPSTGMCATRWIQSWMASVMCGTTCVSCVGGGVGGCGGWWHGLGVARCCPPHSPRASQQRRCWPRTLQTIPAPPPAAASSSAARLAHAPAPSCPGSPRAAHGPAHSAGHISTHNTPHHERE